jgi:hypothetical protein
VESFRNIDDGARTCPKELVAIAEVSLGGPARCEQRVNSVAKLNGKLPRDQIFDLPNAHHALHRKRGATIRVVESPTKLSVCCGPLRNGIAGI